MAWEHSLAKELKKRNNKFYSPFLTGKVLSPIRQVVDEQETFEGSLAVSIYDGQVTLTEDNLMVLQHCGQLYKGQTVALLGEQTFIVLGVV